jgi:citrate lyase subunit beta/citryl-CoA lyase
MPRSWLFTPAHRPERVAKALPADAVILDLEDGVPPAAKAAARAVIAEVLRARAAASGPLRYARLQAPAGPTLDGDLDAAVQLGTDGICVPKVRRATEVAALDAAIAAREAAAGLGAGSVRLLVMVETAEAVLQVAAIAAASPRVAGLMFGSEDLGAELGVWGAVDHEEFLFARSAIALAAAAHGLEAIDRVFPDFRDPAGLQADAERARQLGFHGKAVIHPAQIETVNFVYSPSPGQVETARRIVAAFDAAGGGAVAVDGRMVDAPIAARARRVLTAAGEL